MTSIKRHNEVDGKAGGESQSFRYLNGFPGLKLGGRGQVVDGDLVQPGGAAYEGPDFRLESVSEALHPCLQKGSSYVRELPSS